MTQPNQAKTRRSGYDEARVYSWPPMPPHEFEVISVTSALKSLPKDYLVGWAAKKSAECAVEDHEIIGAMLAKDDKQAALNHIKGARYRDMEKKANRGTIVHAAVEGYLAGKPLTTEQVNEMLNEAHVPLALWKSARGMISGAMEFLFDAEPEVEWSEATVYSREHGYAGTADIIGRMRVGDSVQPVILDFKTSPRIYDETVLQLTAYARADFVGLDDGTEADLIPGLTLPPQYGIVVRPTPSGKYERATFALVDEAFDIFLGVLAVAKGIGRLSEWRRP